MFNSRFEEFMLISVMIVAVLLKLIDFTERHWSVFVVEPSSIIFDCVI